MQHENQFHLRYRHRNHLTLTVYFDAGLVAGTAAFSSLAGALFAGFFSSFLTTAGAGALAAGVGATGAFGASAAKADTANAVAKIAISLFMIFPLRLILN